MIHSQPNSPKKNNKSGSSSANRRNNTKFSSSIQSDFKTHIPKQWSEAKQLLSLDTTNVNTTKCIEDILESLNSISYPVRGIDTEFCLDVIVRIAQYLQSCESQDLLVSKLCQLISTLTIKQEFQFSEKKGEDLISVFIQFISSSSTWLLADCLRTLSFILYDMASKCSSEIYKSILTVVIPQMKVSVSDLEVRKQAINCLVNLFSKTNPEVLSPYCKTIYSSTLQNLEMLTKGISVDNAQKVLYSSLKLLSGVIQTGDKVHVPDIEKIVSHISKLMLFGTIFFPAQSSSNSKKDSGFASDSDYSDSDSPHMNREAIKIRIASLQIINSLAKKDFKSLFAQWKILFSDNDSTNQNPKSKQTLSTVLLFDPSSKVRLAAAQAIASMLENSELYLAQASEMRTKSAFTSFSQTLASIIKELHFTLILSIKKESLPILPVSIRTLSLLIENTPYNKMNCDIILTNIAEILVGLINSPQVDKTVQNQSFLCLATLFGTKEPLSEVGAILRNSKLSIITLLIEYLSEDYVYVIRTEAAQVLANIAKNYPDLLWDNWRIILRKIRIGLNHNDQTLRLTVIQIINNFTSPFSESKIPAVSFKKPVEGFNTLKIDESAWESITDVVLTHALQDSNQSIRSAAVSIFSNIVPSTFDSFGEELSGKIISLVFSSMSDDNANVKSSACRTIGVFVLFGKLQNNLEFMTKSLKHFQDMLSDSSLNIRIRASWSFANMCDALRSSDLKNNLDLVLPILFSSLKACQDNDKVLCNAVRALGNIASFAEKELLNTHIQQGEQTYFVCINKDTSNLTVENVLLQTLSSALISKGSSVKSRWNTCYALGNLIGNVNITMQTIDEIVNMLCERITSDENFKVRIQAVLALSLTKDYGSSMNNFRVWRCLLDSINELSSDNPPAQFSEYKYIKTLKKQILSTLSNFAEHIDLETFLRSGVNVQEYFIETGEIIVNAFSECEWEECYQDTIKKIMVVFDLLELDTESQSLGIILKRHTFTTEQI